MATRKSSFLVLVVFAASFRTVTTECDQSINRRVPEGNIKTTGMFPWIGVLRVPLSVEGKTTTALSGVVLVAKSHALVNAYDISKIPHDLLMEKSDVMFINDAGTWYGGIVSFTVHPEFNKKATIGTIALIQLDVWESVDNPLMPICWHHLATAPSIRSKLSLNPLYVLGFTDENGVLEKVIYKMNFIDETSCRKFYKKAELMDPKRDPVYTICVVGTTFNTRCLWENGMVLVSNATQFFTMLGFGIRGPGCTSPARFIDMQPYLHWMQLTIKKQEKQRDLAMKPRTGNIPIHETFRYSFDVKQPKFPYYIQNGDISTRKYFALRAFDESTYFLFKFEEFWQLFYGSCFTDSATLMYQDVVKVSNPGVSVATGRFRVSLYDLVNNNCTCVRVHVEAAWRSNVTLYIEEFNFRWDAATISFTGDLKEEFFRYYPLMDYNYVYEPYGIPERIIARTYDLFLEFRLERFVYIHLEMFTDKEGGGEGMGDDFVRRSNRVKEIPENIKKSYRVNPSHRLKLEQVTAVKSEGFNYTMNDPVLPDPFPEFLFTPTPEPLQPVLNSTTPSPMASNDEGVPIDVNIGGGFAVPEFFNFTNISGVLSEDNDDAKPIISINVPVIDTFPVGTARSNVNGTDTYSSEEANDVAVSAEIINDSGGSAGAVDFNDDADGSIASVDVHEGNMYPTSTRNCASRSQNLSIFFLFFINVLYAVKFLRVLLSI